LVGCERRQAAVLETAAIGSGAVSIAGSIETLYQYVVGLLKILSVFSICITA
jgi:hypothetical protein